MRINLNTPFAEKDQVKALGARWDPKKKCWYIQNVADVAPFRQWLPSDNTPSATHKDEKTTVVTGPATVPDCGCKVPPWDICPHSPA